MAQPTTWSKGDNVSKEKPEWIVLFTEEDLASRYAEAICKDCQEGKCLLSAYEHDLNVYWGMPEAKRTALVGRVRDAVGNSTVVESVHDVIASVVEEQ